MSIWFPLCSCSPYVISFYACKMSIWLSLYSCCSYSPCVIIIWLLQNVDLTAAFYPLLQKVRDLFYAPTMSISCYHLLTHPTVILDTCIMLSWLFCLLAAPMKCMWSYSMPWTMTLTLPCSWRSYRMYVILFDVISHVGLTLYCWSSVHKPQPLQLFGLIWRSRVLSIDPRNFKLWFYDFGYCSVRNILPAMLKF